VSHERIYQRLRSHLAYLKLPATAEALAGKLDAAQKNKPSYTAFLEDLLRTESSPPSAAGWPDASGSLISR